MKPAPFEYFAPSSTAEVLALLAEAPDESKVLAGGQSLVPLMNFRLARPERLIDLNRVSELGYIERHNGDVVIGAMTRHAEIERSSQVADELPLVGEAIKWVGHEQIRNRGTIGGSLAHAEATAELAAVAVAQKATVRVLGPRGERTVPAADLFVTHLTTSLEPAEVITEVEFPITGGPRTGSSFLEMARRAGDFAMAEVAATISLDDAGRCDEVRLVVGAVADRPVDVSDLARALIGAPPTQSAVTELGRAVADDVEIGPSSHASVEYRREMVAVLVERAVETAAVRAEP